MIRCVVFDFDGTLVDSNAVKYAKFLEVAAELPGGAKTMAVVIDSLTNVTRYEIFDRFVADMRIPEAERSGLSRKMADKYSALCHAEISKAPEIFGAQAALQRLGEQGMRLFVSSATPTEPLRALVRARGWGEMFHGVYGAPASKQAHIRQILDEGGWSPEELVYVGDSDADREAAERSPVYFVAVRVDALRQSVSSQFFVETLNDLPDILLQNF